MANSEHLKILKQGANAWNKWRKENPDVIPDLSNADLIAANLGKVNLSGAKLTGVNLSRTNLEEANLSRADLSGANLKWADLSRVNLKGVDLHGTNLEGANLSMADLTGANIEGANLSGADLIWANLEGVDLRTVDISGAHLFKADLTGANLEGLDLNVADFKAREIKMETSGSKVSFEDMDLIKNESEDSYVYPVWYCTDREPVYKKKKLVDFSNKRGHQNHYGLCKVFIPKSHVIGSLGSPFWKQIVNVLSGHEKDAPLELRSIESLLQNMYWEKIREFFVQQAQKERTALVYIHGYNVSFKQATLRAAQLGVDLTVPLTGYFSWPSQADIKGYTADEASVQTSEQHLAEFLTEFAEKSGAQRIHLLAHSMGNRLLLRSVQAFVQKVASQSNIPFGQIFLAAPDVDRDVFLQLASAYRKISDRTTLYISSKDKALEASGFLHQYNRAGITPPVTIIDGINTIEASKIDFSFLGHGYYAAAKDVLKDIYDLMLNNNPPEKRFALEKVQTQEGIYWRFKE